MKSILLAVPSLARYDAIGNDLLQQREILIKAGYEVDVFAEHVDEDLKHLVMGAKEFKQAIRNPETLLFYHLGVYWHLLESLFLEIHCPLIVKYHNFTPPRFFKPYDHVSFHATSEGLKQAAKIARHPRLKLLIGDSNFNVQELELVVGKLSCPTAVLAPFVPFEMEEGDKNQTSSSSFRVLFVGRFAPNKGHLHLLGVVHAYRELFDQDVLLTMVGSTSPSLTSYMEMLKGVVRENHLENNVEFVPPLPTKELKKRFTSSSAFLCLSEHEGFCVPLVEAQMVGLPVVAYGNGGAVGETAGDGALLGSKLDYDFFASALFELKQNASLRKTLLEKGQKNLARFTEKTLAPRFLEMIDV